MGKGLKKEWKKAERKANYINKKEKENTEKGKEDRQTSSNKRERNIKELKGEIYYQDWERGIEKIKGTKRKKDRIGHLQMFERTHNGEYAFLLWAVNIFLSL